MYIDLAFTEIVFVDTCRKTFQVILMVFNCLNCSSIGAALSNVFQSRHMQFPLSLQLGAIAHGGWPRGSFYNVNLLCERIGIIHRSIRNASLNSCALCIAALNEGLHVSGTF